MATSQKSKPVPRKSAKKTVASSKPLDLPTEISEPVEESRQVRRRRDTRVKMMSAAMRLMSEKGVGGVTIQEITNEADVGFGSFYNHFSSKESLYDDLREEVIGHYAAALETLGEQLTDPAEKICASVRYVMLSGRADPVWGRFVLKTNFNRESLETGFGKYLLRDLMAGIQSKRFVCHDLTSLFVAVGSIILGGLLAEVENAREPVSIAGGLVSFPEHISATLLLTLGLPWKEAMKVAARPLPLVELPVSPFSNS